jgi:hypothetical protein
MPGLVPGIHALKPITDVDGRDEPGHNAFETKPFRQLALAVFSLM